MGTPKHPTPDPRLPGLVWRRVVERIADAEPSHTTVPADAGEWKPFAAGVLVKVLYVESGVMTYLLRLAPGATLPPHRHPEDEECLVLEGCLRVGTTVEVGPGGYHRAHRGSLHATLATDTGATIFLRGAVPDVSQLLELAAPGAP